MFLCPFCQQENSCQITTPDACWCMNTKITPQLLRLVPEGKNKHCICQACITLFNEQPKHFNQQLDNNGIVVVATGSQIPTFDNDA